MDRHNSTPVSLRNLFRCGALLIPCVALLALPGCGSRTELLMCAFDEESCAATDSDTGGWSESEGYGSGETAGPVMCVAEDDCTAEASGDVEPTHMPFFRGKVCLPTAVKPGETIPVALEACIHPCLATSAYANKSIGRCTTEDDLSVTCEAAAMLMYREVTGNACPSDVFGKFDPNYCKYLSRRNITLNPLSIGGEPYSGDATVLIPFLTNDDAAVIDNGDHTPTELFSLIETRPQDDGRHISINVADTNPSAPTDCDQGGCTCIDIGF